jgi:hypothetical protein
MGCYYPTNTMYKALLHLIERQYKLDSFAMAHTGRAVVNNNKLLRLSKRIKKAGT